MKKEMAAFAGFLEKCAWWLALLLMAGLAAAGVVITSQLRAPETVRYATGNVLICVLGACVLAAAVYGLMHAFERMKHIHLMAVLALNFRHPIVVNAYCDDEAFASYRSALANFLV